MKQIRKSFFAALLLVASSQGGAFPAAAQDTLVPLLLHQQLGHPVESIKVLGMHNVTVVADTADFIHVVTSGTVAQIDSLRQPLERMGFSNGALTIPANFPYDGGITVHTSARRLSVQTDDDSRALLQGDDTLRFEFLNLEAGGHSRILAPTPVAADQVYLESSGYGLLRYRRVVSPDLGRRANDESRLEQMGVDDAEEPYNYYHSPGIHRLFYGYSFGSCGWSASPFGGMSVPMGDYISTSNMAFFDVKIGWNFYQLKHWDFGIGFSSTAGVLSSPYLLGTTVDSASGLTHIGPVEEPAFYRSPSYKNETRLWSSSIGIATISMPLRVEWHRRMDYKGLRISAELRPNISLHNSKSRITRQGIQSSRLETDGNHRVIVMYDTIGDLYNRFGCDLRFDIGWSHVSFFVQGALTPLFRTGRKDDLPAVDTPIYPLTMGFSIYL